MEPRGAGGETSARQSLAQRSLGSTAQRESPLCLVKVKRQTLGPAGAIRWERLASPLLCPLSPSSRASHLASLDASPRTGAGVPSREEHFPSVGFPGSATNSMPGGQKARLVPPLCRLKAQEYHTGTKHMEQDNRQGGGLPSEPVSCLPVQPSPHPRLSADDSLEGLPPSQRPIARGCFWTLATSTCEGLTSRPLFPTVLSKRSLHRTNMIKAQNPTRQSFRGSTDEQPLLGQPGIFQRGSIRSCPPTHSSGHTLVLPGSTQTARPTPTQWFRGRMRC